MRTLLTLAALITIGTACLTNGKEPRPTVDRATPHQDVAVQVLVADQLLETLPYETSTVYVASGCPDCPPSPDLLRALRKDGITFQSACSIPENNGFAEFGQDFGSILIEIGPVFHTAGNVDVVYGGTYLNDLGSSGGYYYFSHEGASWRFARWQFVWMS